MRRLHTQSQNFLRDPRLVKTLIGHSTIKKSDVVYDIGAGSGIITSQLAQYCKEVVAIELDARAVTKLRQNTARLPNVSIVDSDFLNMPLPTGEYKVFANIPFHLSSPIVRRLTEAAQPPQAIYLIVQKQFAYKLLIGNTSDYTGLLGAMITPRFTARIRYRLQRTDFLPKPAVDTVMIELLQRTTPLLADDKLPYYRAFIEHCYSRQKYFDSLNTSKRPSQLTTEEWLDLFLRHGK